MKIDPRRKEKIRLEKAKQEERKRKSTTLNDTKKIARAGKSGRDSKKVRKKIE